MCDTLAFKRDGAVWFAKNSDREPHERQVVERVEAVTGDTARRLRCTYIEIDQVPDRRAVLLSRPDWMWGAEMGVNDAGVAIGNEAVFSRAILKKGEALLGMDLVRLGLERARSAEEAVDAIASLLSRYGQGGPAGYRDKNFRYDNSFLIADASAIFVLETAGRDYAVKRADEGWAISNSYTLRDDYDRASLGEGIDFKKTNEAFLMPRLARAECRRSANLDALKREGEMSLARLASALRHHAAGDGFSKGSNRDVCMHASGLLRPHATTGSMVAKLAPGAPPAVAFTGTRHPCISLFKPARFGVSLDEIFTEGLFARGDAAAMRAADDPHFRHAIRQSIEGVEPRLLAALEAGDDETAAELASGWARDLLTGA